MTLRFIAEISSNHNRDQQRILDLIDAAAAIGCDGIKFQLFHLEELFAPQILEKSARHRQRKQWELPLEFLPMIARRCAQKQIRLGCTPFYLEAVETLLPHVDFYKIASYELLWHDLIKSCAGTGKPLILSAGMATDDEICAAMSVTAEAGCRDLTVMHCVSDYPVAADHCNLAAIQTLRQRLARHSEITRQQIGWSDHSVNSGVIHRAVHRWGAAVIEFHLDLDGQGVEFSGGHCWLPHQIKAVIDAVKSGISADGQGTIGFTDNERQERPWRADPGDGLRPLASLRDQFRGDEGTKDGAGHTIEPDWKIKGDDATD